MLTKIIKLNPKNPSIEDIKKAADVIKKGGLVAFPTETVYGLGADALNPSAVKKIFLAKNRPVDNPLIVHISKKSDLGFLGKVTPKAKALIKRFWPGPLTLVVEKKPIVPKETSGGLNTVAVRMPSNKIASLLIKYAGVPIAAPSANLAGKPSPTKAKHVIEDLNGKVDMIIDGGKTNIGLESTVLDLTSHPPTLLRAGKITVEQIERTIGKIEIHSSVLGKRKKDLVAKSPGMKYRHYAPKAKLILVSEKSKIANLIKNYKKQGLRVGVLSFKNSYDADFVKILSGDLKIAAKNLFSSLREFDYNKIDVIISESVDQKGIGLAIMSRLKKAASKII
jgi:L-threonylcarbamoyladenylate synthase